MYTRVFESILDSSINMQEVPTSARWLWIVMMIIADRNRDGTVDMPVERLAAKAGLSVDDTQSALAMLSSPDTQSRSAREDGRRIVPMRAAGGRGWVLVNYEEYKRIANETQQREVTRRRMQAFRDRTKQGVEPGTAEGYVYYAQEPGSDRIKIGFSQNPWARIKEFRTALPLIRLVATERGSLQLESSRHRQFEALRLDGEWFKMSNEIEDFISSLATVSDAVVTPTKHVGDASASVAPADTEADTEKRKNRRSSRSDKTFSSDSMEFKAASHLLGLIKRNNPTAKEPNLQRWAAVFDAIFRIDKRDAKEVRSVIDWCQADAFWMTNILSPDNLRKLYDRLLMQTRKPIASTPPKHAPFRPIENEGEPNR